jgi:imidazolonepropionase-like amidohydrolase
MKLKKHASKVACGPMSKASVAALLAIASTIAHTQPAAAPIETVTHGIVLDGATVVDTRSGKLIPNRALVLDGGKIVQITDAGTIKTAGSAKIVDAHGRFVVPGFLDMHAHPLTAPEPEGALHLMLANGVTGFRQMGGSPDLLERRHAGTLLPTKDAPELLAMPGAILTPENALTPAAAVAEIDRQKAEGADFIKVINVPPPTFFAAMSEAKQQGLTMLGHLPPFVEVRSASNAGMRSIEHLGPNEGLLLGCSTDEAALRTSMQQQASSHPQIVGGDPAVMAAAIANPMIFTDQGTFDRMQHEFDTYSEARCSDLARLFVANQTWQVPTLIRLRTMELADDPQFPNDPHVRNMPAGTRQLWANVAQKYSAKFSPQQKSVFEQLFAAQLRLVKLFDQSGVPMMTGTDAGGSMWVVPGFSLHQEFDLLSQAGLSPLTVLQMTTLNGAKFLGREATMGTVEAGKNADLVVLAANPLSDVRNLHRIDAVVHSGIYYSRSDLDALQKSGEHP